MSMPILSLPNRRVYVNANIVIAQQTGDDNMMNLCRIQRSYIYAIIGQLHESVEEMRQIDHDKLTGGMLIEYLGQMSLLYSRFAEYTDGGSDKRDYYYEREHFYIDSTLNVLPHENPYYILYKGLKDLRAGNYSGSIVAIKVYLETSKTISIANSKLLYIWKHQRQSASLTANCYIYYPHYIGTTINRI